MRVRLLAATFLLTSALLVSPRMASTQEAGVTVFENVRVLTMTDAGTLDAATVIVEGDRVASATASTTEAPSGARVIDGRGMTLLPGLADMHTHYGDAAFGPLFLANGVTTVRDTSGRTQSFAFDARAKVGALAGPHVYPSGPLMDGENPRYQAIVVTSPQEARGAVAAQAVAGFRAVKLYEKLDAQTFSAAVVAAHGLDLQVWAHIPFSLSYDDMLALGVDSIEHLYFTQYTLLDARPDAALPLMVQVLSGWDRVAEARMSDLAARTVEAGLWNVPTLTITTQRLEHAVNVEAFFRRPETKYLPQAVIRAWRAQGIMAGGVPIGADVIDLMRQGRRGRERWVKALHDAGAGLVVGTDAPLFFVVPGYSFHEELDNLSRAGIPNDALLRMATVESARFLEEEGEFGVIAAGARADLILVEGDPWDDLEVLRRPAYVMLNGYLRDRAALQSELDGLASRYARETE